MPQRNPLPAADVLIELPGDRIVLIRRKNPPEGWAIPGGFIEVGESAEAAAIREAREETGLDVDLVELFSVYSDPARDPRHHTLTVVFIGRASGEPVGGDDAVEALAFTQDSLPPNLAFDHGQVLADYFRYRTTGLRPVPRPTCDRQLSNVERRSLLRLARETIRSELAGAGSASGGGATTGEEAIPAGPLTAPGSAFVSLHRGGELRGCIGSFARDRPLYRVVHDMALAAAFDDPRFAALETDELDALEIEISVLSELRRTTAARVEPGLHGISLSLGEMKGVFLPQVAREASWDRETFLAQTCLKAGLPPDAWRDPDVEIAVFTAEVFGDKGV
jgi:8-oxo-dGTP diphosphatase